MKAAAQASWEAPPPRFGAWTLAPAPDDYILCHGESGIKNHNPTTDAAYGVIVADGCFGLAFTLHLMGVPASGLTVFDFVGVGIIFCAFASACWVIYDNYWQEVERTRAGVVKTLRIKELEQGAQIEYDGRSYRIDAINRSNGEVLIERVGQPGGRIVVQIEAQGTQPTPPLYGQ